MKTKEMTPAPDPSCKGFSRMLGGCGTKAEVAASDPVYAKRVYGKSPSGIYANLDCTPGVPGRCPLRHEIVSFPPKASNT